MTSVVFLAALLERISDLNPRLTSRIEPALPVLKQIIQEADGNPNIAHETANAFSETLSVGYKLEDLIESRKKGFLKRIFNRTRKQRKKIKKLCGELIDMIIQEPNASPNHHALEIRERGRAEQVPRPALVEDSGEIVGTEDAKPELVHALTGGPSQLTLISICGIRRTGKTTLAGKLFRSPQIQDHFNVCSWIVVSDGYRTRDILLEILSAIPERSVDRRDAIDMPQDKLAELIFRSLKGRRYLIVLDDVCSADAWFSIRIAFPDEDNGSRILITTRNRDVASRVDGPNSYIHEMRPLTDEQSLELWRRKVGPDNIQVNQEMEQIGREIVRRSEFSSTTSDQVFDVLKLRYENLPLHLRSYLLYLGTFPEDAEIDMDTVCQLLIAEGLVSMEDTGNEETMMDVAARHLDELYKGSLVQIPEDKVSGQSKSCKIHDLIRDFCRQKRKLDGFFEVIDLRDENDQTMSSATRRAIYLDKYEYSHSHLYGNADYLRSLLFFSTSKSRNGIIRPRDIPNLDHFMWVRVLYLYGVDFKYGKLPKGVEKLVYLRYLCFRECYLEELSSSVGNMLYLQALDLRIRNECELTIPDVLNNLERLKHLYMPLAYRTHNGKKLHLGRLKELEILDNFDASLCNVEDLLQLTNLKKLAVTTDGDVSEIQAILEFAEKHMSPLRSLSLNIRNFPCHSKRRFSVMEKVFHCGALHALEVRGYLGKLPDLDTIRPKLTQIVLNSSELAEDPMQILQKLPSLRILVLEIEAFLGKEMKCSPSGFPELRYLKLSELYNLKEWEVEEEALPKLCTLVIENCEKLEMLPQGLQFVTELRKLEIASMPLPFQWRINSFGTKGEDFYKIERAYPNVKIDGQFLIVKE